MQVGQPAPPGGGVGERFNPLEPQVAQPAECGRPGRLVRDATDASASGSPGLRRFPAKLRHRAGLCLAGLRPLVRAWPPATQSCGAVEAPSGSEGIAAAGAAAGSPRARRYRRFRVGVPRLAPGGFYGDCRRRLRAA